MLTETEKAPISTRSVSSLVLLTIALQYCLKYFYKYIVFGEATYLQLAWQYKTVLIIASGLALCFATVAVISRFSFSTSLTLLGLDKDFTKPLLFAALANLPSFVGYAVINGYNSSGFMDVFWGSLLPAFNEEIFYRAFIVGVLVRYANWNFWLTLLLSSLLFAKGHLYQASNPLEAVQIFFFTSGAGIGFALFYKYWNWNIWFPLFMHAFMNMAFVLFSRDGNNALMSGTENIFRFSSIAIAIAMTLYMGWKHKENEISS